MAEATGVQEPPKMSPTGRYERDAAQFYLPAIEALKEGDPKKIRELLPKVFPVRPLVPDTTSIFWGALPYVMPDGSLNTPLELRQEGRLLSAKEYVERLQRIQERGLRSPDRDVQWFSDRNLRGLYFVDRPRVAWGLLYAEVPLVIDYSFANIDTQDGVKPVFKGIMKGTFGFPDEYIVYTLGDKPVKGKFKIGLKPREHVNDARISDDYYREVEKEFRKAFANESNSSS